MHYKIPLPDFLLVNFIAIGLVMSSGGCSKRPDAGSPATAESRLSTPVEPPKSGNIRPTIMSRTSWGAKAPRGAGKENTVQRITIHHTAVAQKPGIAIEKKLQGLQSFSQSESRLASGKLKPVWIDVPYHFYIAVDGKIAEGRPIQIVSDTNTEYDPTGHATIVLEGNFETEQPSTGQLDSLQALVTWLTGHYKVPAEFIKAHNDYAKTACPGVNLKKLLPAIREKSSE